MKYYWGRILQLFVATVIVQYGAHLLGFGQIGRIMTISFFSFLFFELVGVLFERTDES